MVKAAATPPTDPARALAIGYAPAPRRAALAAILALDDALAGVVRATRDPMVGQMRLTWWYGALEALDAAPPPAQPVLQALAAEALTAGVTGASLAAMVDGWEQLLDREPLTPERLADYAGGRGAALFRAAGAVLGAGPADPVAAAGEGWALADLAAHAGDPAERDLAAAMARDRFAAADAARWSPAGRPLGALALLARQDMPGAGRAPAARLAQLLKLRFTGR